MDLEQLGKKLKELRLSHGITLRKFARILGIQPSRLAAIENGRVNEDGVVRPLTDKELVNKLPVFVRTDCPLSDEQLDDLAEKIRLNGT
jgi:transcriptional regulator with XRE-family HTH domain